MTPYLLDGSPLEVTRAERDGSILTVTLCRSEAANSRNQQMRDELVQLWSAVAADETVVVVVLKGDGDRFFCAGMDLKEAGAPETRDERRSRLRRGRDIEMLARVPQPTIAAINGYAFGGGLEMALACDIRVAALETQMGLTELDHGLVPGGGGTQRLPRLVGPARAAEMLFLGRRVTGGEAADLGLVNRAVPRSELMATVTALAATIAEKPTAAVRTAKGLLMASQRTTLEEGVELELEALLELMASRTTMGVTGAEKNQTASATSTTGAST